MWRYLILNTLWFFMLFSVHFYGSKKDQRVLLGAVFAIAVWHLHAVRHARPLTGRVP